MYQTETMLWERDKDECYRDRTINESLGVEEDKLDHATLISRH